MDVSNKKLLHDFKEKYVDVRSHIESWQAEVEEAQWSTPHDLKVRYPKASFVKNRNVIFNFCWNKYRLLAQINYEYKIVLIKKIGTHEEYDNWNIE